MGAEKFYVTFLIIVLCKFCVSDQTYDELVKTETLKANTEQPSVFVAMLVRNKAHTLPWFLYYFERLDYPKHRMRLWIRSDHNEDNSVEIVETWLDHVTYEYNLTDFVDDPSEKKYSDATGPFDWSAKRVTKVIQLRQQALADARESASDFLLIVDVDNFLLNNQLLKDLIHEDRTIISPMFNTSTSDHYSNFWCGMDETGYYKRTDEYMPIYNREKRGVFEVPMVHSTVLIQLRHPGSHGLAYNPPPPYYSGPIDDIIIFAHSAKHHAVPMYVVNRGFYGYMLVPMEPHNTLEEESEQFIHLKMEYILRDEPLEKLPYIEIPDRPLTKLGFDEVYLINLERRSDRRQKSLQCLREMGINATIINAVDGKLLNDTYLQSVGVSMLPGYADPYHGRSMTMGEIGCFLSHYIIWQNVLAKRYQRVMVFEDDARFRPYFPQKLKYLMYETFSLNLNWDLIYLGRKRLRSDDEPYVQGATTLVWPHYSYWTLSYLLTYRGARKLITQNPLQKMVPVDEYLPIMFDKHPETAWKEQFNPRDLTSFSAYPLLVEPTHYTGEPGYITDTEDSPVVDESIAKRTKGDTGSWSEIEEHARDEL